ncbi:signal transduction histidine kinase [Paenibacillus forsythiae]|uniref:histidine kinase n=1 Tax=Paenibacillus forsythiae TaxID=365616 RepID=A0ABU3H841_9BACL|nr:histidine kinase [Paenibacillus forsythiae]MDT3426182.1 signal transduction histidine kinase [Paenibacillus forsythiae]
MRIFASPRNRVLVLLAFKGCMLLAILNRLLDYTLTRPGTGSLLLAAALLAGINDYVRSRRCLGVNRQGFLISIVVSTALLGGISCVAPDSAISIYTLMLVIEIFIFAGDVSVFLLLFHFAGFIMPFMLDPSAEVLENAAVNYGSFVLVGMLFRSIVSEKVKTEQLYSELESANRKLKEYSNNIEELAVAKERARIAQELHDSIGHSLIALSMNLEYAEYAMDKFPAKTKEVISKAHEISREGMANLREAVSVLRESDSAWPLRSSLHEIFANFERTDRIQFDLRMDEELENEEPDIKSCLYKTVREAVTNGIRHGRATAFTVDIRKREAEIMLVVNNNGLGSGHLMKSDGLQGIERRAAVLGGKLHIQSGEEKGFTLEVRIPG